MKNQQHLFNQNQNININQLLQECNNLKKKLQSFQEKEKLYQSSISKLKKFQNEYQQTFNKTLNDYKLHEEQIKKTYINYQKLIENHYKKNENKFLEEISKLNMDIRQKNNIINNLNNKIIFLNKKLNKMESDYQIKNKKLESEVVSKERKLNELNESMIQLARDTNDEIKLLRDEFEFFNNRKIKNKRYQSLQKTEDYKNNSSGFNEFTPNNLKSKRYYYDGKEEQNNKKINYLTNKISMLEIQNKNLKQRLERKEEELVICNKLKNELFYENNMKNYFPSFSNDINNDRNTINKLKFNKSSSNFINYKNQNKHSNFNYIDFSNKSKDIIPKTNITFKNDLKLKYNLFKEKRKNTIDEIDNNYNPILNDYDINELVITNNKNNYQNMKDYGNDEIINQDERIKDEYINSKLPKINTLD